jgi:hypothetical protein
MQTSTKVDELLAKYPGRYTLGQAIAQAVQQEVTRESEFDKYLNGH